MQTIKSLRVLAGIFLVAAALEPAADAQPLIDGFTPGQGEWEVAVGLVEERYEDFFIGSDPAPRVRNFDRVEAHIATLFATYGITDNLEVVVNVPWMQRETNDGSSVSRSGFQDGQVYLNWRAYNRETTFGGPGFFSVLLGGGLVVPLSDYEPDRLTSLGHHSTDLDAMVTLHQVWASGWYATAQVGHLWRLEDPPNAWNLTLRAGWFNARMFTAFWWHQQDSTSGTDIGVGPFSTNEIDSHSVGAEFSYRFTDTLALSAKISGVLDGRNVDQRTTVSLGLIRRF